MTRQQITHAMERLAFQTHVSERLIAESVYAAARQPQKSLVARTAGYYLLGAGRNELLGAIGAVTSPSKNFFQFIDKNKRRHWRLPIYLFSWFVGTLAVLLWAAQPLSALHATSWVALLLMAWPASEAVASLIHRLVAESTQVQTLARLDFALAG